MATITKKAAKRISDLLAEASLHHSAAELSILNDPFDYWRCSLKEGLVVRVLFDEFGIEAPGFSWYTKDKLKGLEIKVAERKAHDDRYS